MEQTASRQWDFPSASIVFIAVLTAAGRLLATDWVPHLEFVEALAALGVILGLALGQSMFSRRSSFWLAFGYSLVILPWQLSRAIEGAASWSEELNSVGGRLIYSLAQFSSRQPVDDYLLFLTFVCILFWIISIYAGYSLTRHRNVLAIAIPPGIGIMIVQTYDWVKPGRLWYLGIYLFLIILLVARINHLNSMREWKRRRVFMSPEVGTDISTAILIASFILVFVTWNYPLNFSASQTANRLWNDLTEPLDELKRRFQDAFSAIKATTGVGTRDFYGSVLSLGLGNPLSDTVIFTVDVPIEALELPRLYWRGRTYDQYQKGQWSTSADRNKKLDPLKDSITLAGTSRSREATFTFTTYINNQSLLYTYPNLVQLSRPASMQFIEVPVNQVEMAAISLTKKLRPGEIYSARSVLLNPTIIELQTAGEVYPKYVKDYYLQLPEDMSPKVVALAQEITRFSNTPYDKAMAITNYLRREIEYTETIPAPPPNTDPIEWFLLVHKKGFCNYYASSEVLMLRAVGVPARMAVGFAQGQSTAEQKYSVRQKEAHAWPEVYFPGVGWVQFEPTVNQAPLIRPVGEEEQDEEHANMIPANQDNQGDDAANDKTDNNTSELTPEQKLTRILDIVLWFIIIVAAGLLVYRFWRSGKRRSLVAQAPAAIVNYLEKQHIPVPTFLRYWLNWIQAGPTMRAFSAINQGLFILGKPQPLSATPAERAEVLASILPEAQAEINVLLGLHQETIYSPHETDAASSRRISMKIRYLAVRHIIESFF